MKIISYAILFIIVILTIGLLFSGCRKYLIIEQDLHDSELRLERSIGMQQGYSKGYIDGQKNCK